MKRRSFTVRSSNVGQSPFESLEARAAAANLGLTPIDANFDTPPPTEEWSSESGAADNDKAFSIETFDSYAQNLTPLAAPVAQDRSAVMRPQADVQVEEQAGNGDLAKVDKGDSLRAADDELREHQLTAIDPTIEITQEPAPTVEVGGAESPASGNTPIEVSQFQQPKAVAARPARGGAPQAAAAPIVDAHGDAVAQDAAGAVAGNLVDTQQLGDGVGHNRPDAQIGDDAGPNIFVDSATVPSYVDCDGNTTTVPNRNLPDFVDTLVDNDAPGASERLPGDVNKDGRFNSADIVEVFRSGQYQTRKNASFEQGDWNNDGVFDSNDFVHAFSRGRYDRVNAIAADNDGFIKDQQPSQNGLPSLVLDREIGDLRSLDADPNVAIIEDYMDRLDLPGLNAMGTISACQVSETIRPGMHVLSSDPSAILQKANLPNLIAGQFSTLSYSSTTLKGSFVSAGTDQTTDVVRFEGDELLDKAVIIADTVVFDDAVLTLDDSVRELIIVAGTVVTSGDSQIRWERSGNIADEIAPLAQADDGRDLNPSQVPSGNRHGGDGTNGATGRRGNNAYQSSDAGAPTINFYVREFQLDDEGLGVLPDVELTGEIGGRGQDGQDGGDGGDGGKGTQAESWEILGLGTICMEKAGEGGDGGDGGDAGDGGDGGRGGAGGNVNVYYVEAGLAGRVHTSNIDVDGGAGGAPGQPGQPGDGGRGGEGGDGDGFCADKSHHPDYVGDDGRDGDRGQAGDVGAAGDDGELVVERISMDDWEEAFTRPYLVSIGLDSVPVGQVVTIETLNVSGPATLFTKDYFSGTTQDHTLVPNGDNQYDWYVPIDFVAGEYDVMIERDDLETSPYQFAIEVEPVVLAVQFEDEYDALPGGTAYLTGYGFRHDSELLYDGQRVDIEWGGSCTGLCGGAFAGLDYYQFTIPNVATNGEYFQHDDGETDHTVQIDQAYPLANSEVETVRLKKHDGYTFRPSVNGYQFSNEEMASFARNEVTINPVSTAEFREAYDLFRESYGEGEISVLGGLLNTTVWKNFGLWYAWWVNPMSATCTGMSVPSIRDYFNGVSDQLPTTEADALETVVEATTHVLGHEFLSQMVVDTIGSRATTNSSIEQVAEFMANGTDESGAVDAPVLVMAPSGSVYTDALTAPLDAAWATIEAAASALTSFNPRELLEIPQAFDDMIGEFADVINGIGNSHSITPYLTVYDNYTDEDPSRIYVYDSNSQASVESGVMTADEVDEVFMEIERDDDKLEFHFQPTNSPTYEYGTDEDWMLSAHTVDFLSGSDQVSLPLMPGGWSFVF